MHRDETSDILRALDDEYLSGPWTGFYTYAGGHRERMDLFLSFREGRVAGSGTDPVGPFRILGGYDPERGEVWWTKAYVGAHEVRYRGFRDAHGIWGTWEIPPGWTGGFHIWPRGQGEGAAEEAEAIQETPVGAIARPGSFPPAPHSRPPFHLDSTSGGIKIRCGGRIAGRYGGGYGPP